MDEYVTPMTEALMGPFIRSCTLRVLDRRKSYRQSSVFAITVAACTRNCGCISGYI